jgi:hypothetical protein
MKGNKKEKESLISISDTNLGILSVNENKIDSFFLKK